jgi:AcrR family transcriptional regulator
MSPATKPKPRLPAAERRELILAAAMNRFGAGGYDATRLEDIAADAGVTKPILYRHFGSKQGLYLAVLARHREDLPTFLEDLPAEPDLERLARAILDGWLAYAYENRQRWRMLFRDQGGGEEIRRARAEVHERAREVLAAFLQSRPEVELPPEQVEPTAELLSHGLASLVLWWGEHPDVPRARMVDVATRVVAGIGTGSPSPRA